MFQDHLHPALITALSKITINSRSRCRCRSRCRNRCRCRSRCRNRNRNSTTAYLSVLDLIINVREADCVKESSDLGKILISACAVCCQ